jgi:O-antigen/teichoic acid export membrane protein
MASNVLRSANLAPHLTAGAIFVFFLTVNGYQTGALSGLEAYGRLGRAGATSAIVSAPATAFFAWKYGLMGAVSGMAFGAALRWLVHHEHLRRATHEAGVVIRHGKLRNVTPLLKRFAVPAALSGYVTAPAIWAASAMVFRQPGGAEAMAFYGAAATFRTAVLFLPNILNNVGLSILNHTKGGGDTGAYFGVFRRNVALMVLAAAAPSAALAFLGGGALRAFGPRYEEEAYRLLLVLLLAAVLEATSTGMYQLVQSHEQMWTSLFLIVTPRDGVLLLAAAILVPRHGVMGLAASAAVAQALGLAMTFLVGRHIRTRVLTPAGIVPRYSFSTRDSE